MSVEEDPPEKNSSNVDDENRIWKTHYASNEPDILRLVIEVNPNQ
jgi:hypothetical protein